MTLYWAYSHWYETMESWQQVNQSISKINEVVPQRQQVIGHAGIYGVKARSKRYVLRHFLKVETEVDEWTDSGKLFQREGAQELNDLFPALVLTLGTDKEIPLFDVSEHDGSGAASKECK